MNNTSITANLDKEQAVAADASQGLRDDEEDAETPFGADLVDSVQIGSSSNLKEGEDPSQDGSLWHGIFHMINEFLPKRVELGDVALQVMSDPPNIVRYDSARKLDRMNFALLQHTDSEPTTPAVCCLHFSPDGSMLAMSRYVCKTHYSRFISG